ncbi:MAG: aspartyl protease family protein [Deltaproteobacteria bacterium]|nr:aspartyl protease family protein [Deltaproteobacteria bacterium]
MTASRQRRRRATWVAGVAAASLSLCSAATAVAQSKLFQWKDANGVLHFSNSAPPPGADVTVTTTQSEFRPVPLEVDDVRSHKLVRVGFKGSRGTAQTQMIVDTGAQVTMIDEALASDIGVRWIREELLGGVGGFTRGSRVQVASLRIGNAEIKDIEVIVGPPGLRLLGIDVLTQLQLTVGQNSLYRGR